MTNKRFDYTGFTLIELLVVIAIIAILAAIIAPNAFRAIEKAKISATIADLRSIKNAATAYYADTGTWPPWCSPAATPPVPCTALITNPGNVTGWDGPYVEKWPTPKWGGPNRAYRFVNAAWEDWDGDGTWDLAYFVQMSPVPLPSAQKIDREIDGVTGPFRGSVHYATWANPSYIRMLIFTEVTVNY